MFYLDKYRVKIKVNLDNGVYEFEHYSNTGKSYLCSLCKQYYIYGESVDGYDYYDYKKKMEIPRGLNLLVVDRYDMFSEFDDVLKEIGRESIVLVTSMEGRFEDTCQIEIVNPGLISVY